MYTPKFDKSHKAPEGRVTLWTEGPEGGVHYGGHYTPDELDQLALAAAHAAERERMSR